MRDLSLSYGPGEFAVDFNILHDWRGAHSYPLTAIHATIEPIASFVEPQALVVNRLKRHISIMAKLFNERTRLTQMQDIAGCRVIMSDVDKVRAFVEAYRAHGELHELDHVDDYINRPRDSGYRGVHLIYRFKSNSSHTKPYDRMKVEIQARTILQHAWATAVETVGTFTDQALKSSQGQADFLRFFRLMGSCMAIKEGTPLVPGTPENESGLVDELRKVERRLDFRRRFEVYGHAVHEDRSYLFGAEYYLLDLDLSSRRVSVTGFSNAELSKAQAAYGEAEQSIDKDDPRQVVLVKASSLDELRSAYRNYYLDTNEFNAVVSEFLQESAPLLF